MHLLDKFYSPRACETSYQVFGSCGGSYWVVDDMSKREPIARVQSRLRRTVSQGLRSGHLKH